MGNPFKAQERRVVPGQGRIHVARLASAESKLKTVSYQYPLKLVTTSPKYISDAFGPKLIHTIYMLTYGGGLLAGDEIDLDVHLDATTRLVLQTQGHTKLFRSDTINIVSHQHMQCHLAPASSLCLLPDPVQPFEDSAYAQKQIFNVYIEQSSELPQASMCILDWVSSGRPASGENWSLRKYNSLNEIFAVSTDGSRRLLLRDNLALGHVEVDAGIANRMASLAVFGTLIVYGPVFTNLASFLLNEFATTPRLGAQRWARSQADDDEDNTCSISAQRQQRQKLERGGNVTWSAASVRGFVIIKFGAHQLEDGRHWLSSLLREEGTVAREFGERALLCLR